MVIPKIFGPPPKSMASTSAGLVLQSIGRTNIELSASGYRKHLPGIHGLRAVAALAIVAYHTCYISKPLLIVPQLLAPSVSNLGLGVHLFFIISTFSLMHSYDEISKKKGWMFSYAIKRFFRIAPMFYLLILYNYGNFVTSLPIGRVAANIAFVFNFFPKSSKSIVWAGWTIGVEMPVYAILPFVIHKFRRLWLSISLTVVAFAVSIVSRLLIADSSLPDDYAYFSFVGNIGVFAAGAMAHHLVKAKAIKGLLLKAIATGSLVGLLALAIIPGRVNSIGPSLEVLLWSTPLSLLCIWQAVQPSRLLASFPMQWIGERSFSVYLLHPFIVYQLWKAGVYEQIYSVFHLFGSWAYVLCVATTISVVLLASAITYSLVERPGQKLGNALIRFMYQRQSKPKSLTVKISD